MGRKKKRYRQRTAGASMPAGPPTIGKPSTFRSKPWWLSDWWLLDSTGHSADVSCDVGTIGDLAVAGASIRGNSHRVDGDRCEDAFFLSAGATTAGQSFLVAVVGDGVGSAAYSSFGSRRVTQLFGSNLTAQICQMEELTQKAVDDAVVAAFTATKSKASSWEVGDLYAPPLPSSEIPSSAIESTLTFALIPARPDADATRSVFLGWIGDSPVFKLHAGKWERLTDTGDSEIVDSATEGVHSAEQVIARTTLLTDGDVLVLTTDGVGNFLTAGGDTLAVGSHLAGRWNQPVSLNEFVDDMMFDFRTADDDRTAIVCWPNRSQHTA
jgi:serine/threonine protein phosphatase PrpC